MTATVDTTKLTATLRRYASELNLSFQKVVRHQAGLLKVDIVAALPPKNLARSKQQAEKDARKVFFPKPVKTFTGSQAEGKQMRWLYAANQPARVLVGVSRADYQPELSADQMRRVQYETRLRGKAWEQIGTRGKNNPFKVMRLNRVVVARGRLKQHIKALKDSFGKLKASWAVDWERFNIARTLPGWIRKHVPTAKGRTVDMSKLADTPFVEIISDATGVSKPQALKAIRAAVKKRVGAMTADLRNQLRGAYKRAGFANAR